MKKEKKTSKITKNMIQIQKIIKSNSPLQIQIRIFSLTEISCPNGNPNSN